MHNNAHFIEAMYKNTGARGAGRMKLESMRNPDLRALFVPIDNTFRDVGDQASAWLESNGYTILNTFTTKHGYGFTVRESLSLRDAKAGRRQNNQTGEVK